MAPRLSKPEPTNYEAHKHPSTYQPVTERVLIQLEGTIPKRKKGQVDLMEPEKGTMLRNGILRTKGI